MLLKNCYDNYLLVNYIYYVGLIMLLKKLKIKYVLLLLLLYNIVLKKSSITQYYSSVVLI